MNTADLFKKLLSYKSITPHDDGAFEFIEDYLSDFTAERIDAEDTKNLFMYKKFGKGPHLCFAGHIDVVPSGEGWESDPFVPTEKNGFIYARGTQDMKSGVCALLKACKEAKNFKGTLSVLLTSDEEGDAKHGTIEVLKDLKKRDFLPDYALVAEPTCEEKFGDAIKVGRRGSINGVVEVAGKQGHAAYPEKTKNPVHEAAKALSQVAGVALDSGDEFFSPSRFVITDIRAGMEVTNVTPGKLKMMFNVRNSTKTTKEDIEDFVRKHFEGIDFTLTLYQGAKPFLTGKNSKVVCDVEKAINVVCGLYPKRSAAGGTSDARFFGEYGIDTVELGVINDTIHAPNERTTLKEVEDLEKVFKKVIENF